MKITYKPLLNMLLLSLLLLLSACSSKSTLVQNQEIYATSHELVSIHAREGANSYYWTQRSGVAVAVTDSHSASLQFIAPEVSQEERLSFELVALFGNTIQKVTVTVIVSPAKEDENTTSGDSNSTSGNDGGNTTIGSNDNNTTTLQSLTLSIIDSKLNKETNTTLTLTATTKDGKTKNITDNIEWLITPKDTVSIHGLTLTALNDTNVTLQAKYQNKLSNPVKLSIYWEVNGHRLPPEPDPAVNNATLLGIDSNNNGVRDDVERWIYKTYKEYIPCRDVKVTDIGDNGDVIEGYKTVCEDHPVPYHPVVRAVAMQGARAAQIIIQHPEKAQETLPVFRKAHYCAMYISLYKKTIVDNKLTKVINYDIFKEGKGLISKQFNTTQRARAYAKFNFYLSGGVYEVPTEEEIIDGCNKEVKKYLKDLK